MSGSDDVLNGLALAVVLPEVAHLLGLRLWQVPLNLYQLYFRGSDEHLIEQSIFLRKKKRDLGQNKST